MYYNLVALLLQSIFLQLYGDCCADWRGQGQIQDSGLGGGHYRGGGVLRGATPQVKRWPGAPPRAMLKIQCVKTLF